MGTQDFAGHSTGIGSSPRLAVSDRIAEGAECCLRHNAYLAMKNLQCECHEGVLILRGCLPTYYLKQLAQTLVAGIDGVQRIVNEIEVVCTRGR